MPKKEPEETAFYAKLPAAAVEKITRAAEKLGVAKKDLVADLVSRYVDPEKPTFGSYSFRAYDRAPESPEVMTAAQAAELLQVEERVVLDLAESGKLPGRKLGMAWRFSRAAVLAWLAGGA